MNFSNTVHLIWEIALTEAVNAKQEYIEPEHLLLGICSLDKIIFLVNSHQLHMDSNTIQTIKSENKEIEDIFSKKNMSLRNFRRALRSNIDQGSFEDYEQVIHRSEYSKQLFDKAGNIAQEEGLNEFRSIHLLNVIVKENIFSIDKTLQSFNTDAAEVNSIINETDYTKLLNPDSVLETYGINLTRLAKEDKLDPVIGMDDELLKLVRTLNKRKKNNALIVGEAGVGKSTLVRKLAIAIANKSVGEHLNKKEIVEINMGSLVSGTKYRGDFEEKINRLLIEVKENPNLILFIDEAHTIIGTGSNGSLDASNMIKSSLQNGDLTIIGATTLEEYTLYFEKESAFERRFQPIMIKEPSQEATIEILRNIKTQYENFHNVEITDEAIIAAVKLSVRYILDRNLPDKALDVIDEACSRKVIPKLNLSCDVNYNARITEHDVKLVISDWRCIPVIDYSFAIDKLANMENFLNDRIIGQEEAVKDISNRIKKALLGIQDVQRPLAVFLFIGPNGVGKTYAGKILSEFLFEGSRSLHRLDMSEYTESHNITKLIGPPPGYKGNEEGGFLTNAIKNNPYSIILIENIEKAHPQILDILLQLFENGKIVDSKNKNINANNCIFIITSEIATSNKLTGDVMYGDGFSEEIIVTTEDYSKLFRRDLIEVVDDIVEFKELNEKDFEKLIENSLNTVSNRILREKDIQLCYDKNVIKLLAKKGYKKEYGAKYLNKYLEKTIEFPFTDLILNREVTSGDEVLITAIEDEIEFIKK